ncbi:hypothetical protein MNAN1_000159 [Malassezia nana]|uniref:Uncharacterized protein n=1 Tax=Malassezia nana TaxID=180528 RepID=A0AAF0J244_9BASI|nr:hypothetical protein MNAN1_000159 [Malassezia nana]
MTIRRSARLRARASMPSLQRAWTPEKDRRPEPLTQQTASVQHRLDLASPSAPNLVRSQPEKPVSAVQDTHTDTSSPAQLADDTLNEPSSLCTTVAQEDDTSQEMDLSVIPDPSPSEEAAQDGPWEDIDGPAKPSSTEPVGPNTTPRYPSKNGTASPRMWSSTKSRKVSLRTATLLKRSAQLPILPIPATRRSPAQSWLADSEERAPTSSGSQDMDMSCTVSTPAWDDESDDESEVEQSLLGQDDTAKDKAMSTPQDQDPAPRNLSQTFLTPQVEKPQNPAHRRLSFEPAKLTTPRLKHKNSWQWLKGMFSPSSRDSTTSEPAASTVEPESEARETMPCIDTARVSEEDEFFDTDEEVMDTTDRGEETLSVQELGVPGPHTSPDVGQEPAAPHLSCTPSPIRSPDAPTPDMKILKHLFAEPKPAMSAELAMSDFRHLIYKDERHATMAPDVSLGSPCVALEKEPKDVHQPENRLPASKPDKDTPSAQDKQLPAVDKPSPYMPAPLHRMGAQQRIPNKATSQPKGPEGRTVAERALRSVPNKEPYVPIRRQLPPRNAVKTSRFGSLSSMPTRSAAAASDAKENLRKTEAEGSLSRPARSERTTTTSYIPMARPAGTKTSSTTLAQQYRRPTRAMESRTNLRTHETRGA